MLRQRPSSAEACFFVFMDSCTACGLQYRKGKGNCLHARGWCIVILQPIWGPRMTARLVKHLLPLIFPASIWSIWHDSKFPLRQSAEGVLHSLLLENNASIVLMAHPYRSTSWDDERTDILRQNLSKPDVMDRQRRKYVAHGLMLNSTQLPDSKVYIRHHVPASVLEFSMLWIKEVMHFPPRDQLSFPFALSEAGFVNSSKYVDPSCGLLHKSHTNTIKTMSIHYVHPQGCLLALFSSCRFNRRFHRYGHTIRHGSTC